MAEASYRKLIAWQRAMELAEAVYRSMESFPANERYALLSQVRRAAVSVPSNLAEGHGRGTPKALVSFIRIATGSLKELETQLLLANRLGYAPSPAIEHAPTLADEVGRLLTDLRRSLEDKS